MRNNVNTLCDACGAILEGRDRMAEVKKDHLSLSGKVLKVAYGPLQRPFYVYGMSEAQQQRGTHLDFCNGKCLDAFMEALQEHYKSEREARLRREVIPA